MSTHPPYTIRQRFMRTLVICPIMVVGMVSYNLLLHGEWEFANLGATFLYMFPIAYFLDFAIMFNLVRFITHKVNRPKIWILYPAINVGLMAVLCSGIALAVGGYFSLESWGVAFLINYPVALALLLFAAKPAGDKLLKH